MNMTQFYKLCQQANSIKDLAKMAGMTVGSARVKRSQCRKFAKTWELPWKEFPRMCKKQGPDLQEIADIKGISLRRLRTAITMGKIGPIRK